MALPKKSFDTNIGWPNSSLPTLLCPIKFKTLIQVGCGSEYLQHEAHSLLAHQCGDVVHVPPGGWPGAPGFRHLLLHQPRHFGRLWGRDGCIQSDSRHCVRRIFSPLLFWRWDSNRGLLGHRYLSRPFCSTYFRPSPLTAFSKSLIYAVGLNRHGIQTGKMEVNWSKNTWEWKRNS